MVIDRLEIFLSDFVTLYTITRTSEESCLRRKEYPEARRKSRHLEEDTCLLGCTVLVGHCKCKHWELFLHAFSKEDTRYSLVLILNMKIYMSLFFIS